MLCRIVMLTRVYVSVWHYQRLYHITTYINCYVNSTILNHVVALWHSSRFMLYFDIDKGIYWITTYDIYQYLCWIATFLNSAFLNGFVTLWHSSQRSKHLFMDIEIHHSSMLVSHYLSSCCENFLDIYIVVWQTKWFKPSTFYIVM